MEAPQRASEHSLCVATQGAFSMAFDKGCQGHVGSVLFVRPVFFLLFSFSIFFPPFVSCPCAPLQRPHSPFLSSTACLCVCACVRRRAHARCTCVLAARRTCVRAARRTCVRAARRTCARAARRTRVRAQRTRTCVHACVCAHVSSCILYARVNLGLQVAAVNVSFLVLFCQFYFKTYKKPRKATEDKASSSSNGVQKPHQH
jgi:hypothetical protein